MEYLFEDGSDAGTTSLGARLCYGTGYTYLTFLGIGGLYGLADGLRNPLGQGSRRLRLACVMNGVTARGPFIGNIAAIVAVLYNGLHGLVVRGVGREDWGTALGSAAVAGGLFKSTRGAQAMLRSSLGLTAFVGGFRLLSTYLSGL